MPDEFAPPVPRGFEQQRFAPFLDPWDDPVCFIDFGRVVPWQIRGTPARFVHLRPK